jgi:hypothetical protein
MIMIIAITATPAPTDTPIINPVLFFPSSTSFGFPGWGDTVATAWATRYASG